ncbi:hypothetical protein ACFL2C_02310 [Patescibacteria group bacterium]
MDYSARTPVTHDRLEILKSKAKRVDHTKIIDTVFKPVGIALKDFPPDRVWVRLRKFFGTNKPSSLIKVTVQKGEYDYTKEILGEGSDDEMIQKAKELGYEKWGVINLISEDYKLGSTKIYYQKLSHIGEFIKIDSDTKENLDEVLKTLGVKKDEIITKNAAVLLTEKLKLI